MTVAPASVTATGRGSPKSAEAVIVDDNGTVVAQRTLTDRTAKVCLPLARAVGAWASLVLDAELARAKDDDGSEPTPSVPATVPGVVPATPTLQGEGTRPSRDSALGADGEPGGPVHHSVELGTMVYLRDGMTPTGGFVGVTPFITIEVATSWVLRPALAFGRSTSPIPISATETAMMSHVGARADFCRRVPGNYIERRGIEADLCFGTEASVVSSERVTTVNERGSISRRGDAARFGVGPSANLRGELALGLALEVRGVFGANLLNSALVDEGSAPLVFAAGELGISMRLP